MRKVLDHRSTAMKYLGLARAGYDKALPISGDDLIKLICASEDLRMSDKGKFRNDMPALYYVRLEGNPDLTKSKLYGSLVDRFGTDGSINHSGMVDIRISNSVLKGVNFSSLGLALKVHNSDLSEANLSNSILSRSEFSNSFLNGVDMAGTFLFADSIYNNPSFRLCDLRDMRGFAKAHGITQANYKSCLMSPSDIEIISKQYASERFIACEELSAAEKNTVSALEDTVICPGCDTPHGQKHRHCDRERCPACGGQKGYCGCKKKKRGLNPVLFDQREVLSEAKKNFKKVKEVISTFKK